MQGASVARTALRGCFVRASRAVVSLRPPSSSSSSSPSSSSSAKVASGGSRGRARVVARSAVGFHRGQIYAHPKGKHAEAVRIRASAHKRPTTRAVSSASLLQERSPPSKQAIPQVSVTDACDLAEEEEVSKRAVITMIPGATVTCTAEEERIFATLLEVVEKNDLPVTLRVAGGWVRDKLLGKNSTDIDIAIDSLLGREFAELVNAHLREKGETVHGVGVIQSNPDQSKHLETATMRVHDVWLDLVNLRSENYSEESRIPEMTFGSATDDAFRRDLTINALFYNINLKQVEDFTGMGLKDLQDGVVRTPLPPKTTFLDDPLRILRAVRFASRFGFVLDDEIVSAAGDADVQCALRTKVSRERVGKEVSGMLRGPSPGDAMTLLCRFSLFEVVFTPASLINLEALSALPPNTTSWACLHSLRSLDALLSAHANAGGKPWSKSFSCEEREWLVLAAFLAPLRTLCVPPQGKKQKPTPLVEVCVKEALKMRGKDADAVSLILDAAVDMRAGVLGSYDDSVAASIAAERMKEAGRVETVRRQTAGRAIRRGKEQWRLALVIGAVMEMPGVVSFGDGDEVETWAVELSRGGPVAQNLLGQRGSPLHAFSAIQKGAAGVVESSELAPAGIRVRTAAAAMAGRVRTVEELIFAMKLDRAYELKPLLAGQEIMRLAGMSRGGPAMKVFNERLIDWQLENPESGADDARAYIESIREEVMHAAAYTDDGRK